MITATELKELQAIRSECDDRRDELWAKMLNTDDRFEVMRLAIEYGRARASSARADGAILASLMEDIVGNVRRMAA